MSEENQTSSQAPGWWVTFRHQLPREDPPAGNPWPGTTIRRHDMFYCDPCGAKRGWPQTMARSRGPCEICGEARVCSDLPSRLLPRPAETPDVRTMPPHDQETGT